MGISKSLRFAVLSRDKYTCQYCGNKAPDVILQVDHIIPLVDGGTQTADNLVAACKDCNAGKSTKRAGVVEPAIVLNNEYLNTFLAELEESRRLRIAINMTLDIHTAELMSYWAEALGKDRYLKENAVTIKHYLQVMPGIKVQEAMDIALRKYFMPGRMHPYDAWRYLCGVLKKMVVDIVSIDKDVN